MNASSALLAALLLAACSSMQANSLMRTRHFGVDQSGRPATLWTLRAGHLEVDVTDYGATLVAVRAPDRAGFVEDVVLGFDDVSGYESGDNQYFGCTTGRVCNRIKKGEFTLDGYTYVLATNNGPNHLHGGASRSLDKVHWYGEVVTAGSDRQALRFTYLSKDGEEGYPGNLRIQVTYTLTSDDRLRIEFAATTDRSTPVNLTNHAYWNLAGAGAPTVLDHTLSIDAQDYTPTDDTLIPTGTIAPVLGTPLDFARPTPIGLRIEQLVATPALGYDHNYVLAEADGLRRAAVLQHASRGRSLTVETTEPGLQFYSGNFLRGQRGKSGKAYPKHSAICLEPQHFPDSVNKPRFPNTILEPGKVYSSTTVLTFVAD